MHHLFIYLSSDTKWYWEIQRSTVHFKCCGDSYLFLVFVWASVCFQTTCEVKWAHSMLTCFLIQMSNMWIYLISCVCPSGWLSSIYFSFMAKTSKLDILQKTFLPNSFTPMLIGTTDLLHYIPLSMTFTSVGGYKFTAKQNLSGFIFLHSCQLIEVRFGVVVKQFKLNIMMLLFLVRVIELREITVVLLTASNNFYFGRHWDIYELIWFNLGVMIDATELYILIFV